MGSAVEVFAETALDPRETEAFYPMYLGAFSHLRTHAAARQVLDQDEFFAEMDDPRVTKYVARTSDGEAVGLATLVTTLDLVPWISPEYYAARYPEQAARGAIHYVGFMLSHPERRSVVAYPLMVNAILTRCSEERAALLWDICAFNHALGFSDSLTALVKRRTGEQVETLDTQTYYGVAFP